MKIGVCISKTPETTSRISFKNNMTEFDTEGVSFIMNPYDEWYALVRALELKESGVGSEVIIIHVGGKENEAIIRKALAIGADRALRYDTAPDDALKVAHQIADAVRKEGISLLFLGKETIDYNGAEVAAMVAELLDWPFASFVNKIDVQDSKATVRREIEGGTETAEMELPLVISASKDLAQQRIPNMRGIMMAKRKPIDVLDAVDSPLRTKIQLFELPQEKTGVTMVDPEDMDHLVRLLHEEAKVI